MTVGDLKFLPACEVKDILESKPLEASKTAKTSPKSKEIYVEESVKLPQRVIDKVKESVPADIPFEGAYIEEFSKRTLIEHHKLIKEYQTEILNKKITEQGSMYG